MVEVSVRANDADSFRFWESYYKALRILPTNAQRGEFVTALCEFVFDGVEEPTITDVTVDAVFAAVADQARQSMQITRQAREWGKRGGRGNKKPDEKVVALEKGA